MSDSDAMLFLVSFAGFYVMFGLIEVALDALAQWQWRRYLDQTRHLWGEPVSLVDLMNQREALRAGMAAARAEAEAGER